MNKLETYLLISEILRLEPYLFLFFFPAQLVKGLSKKYTENKDMNFLNP